MEVFLTRTLGGFSPADDDEAVKCQKFGQGEIVRCSISMPRNIQFHRKFFAMLNVGFDAWEPPAIEHKGLPVQKNFDRFRKDCVIAAGFYDVVVNLKGETRAEARSISFASMDDDEFEKVYSAVADVLLQRVLKTYSRPDLDRVVEEIVGFT